jgi:2-iminobutanoate/2-iminopropanoate deaminase
VRRNESMAKIKEEIFIESGYVSPNPLSQAIRYGDLIFCSGYMGRDPKTKKIVPGGMKAQTRQALENLGKVLVGAGSSFDKVLKVTVFITKKELFSEMNEVYREYFYEPFPARMCVEVSGMMLEEALVEIDCIAGV